MTTTSELTPEQARRALEARAKEVGDAELERVLESQQDVESQMSASEPLSGFLAEVKSLFAMVKDYWKGAYREVPWFSIASGVAALLYVLNPMDLIPDMLPVVGQIDDAAVVAVCLGAVKRDLNRYREWKGAQGSSSAT